MGNWLKALKLRISGHLYPDSLHVFSADDSTVDFVRTTGCKAIAEIGVYTGCTSLEFAKYLDGEGELHLFDFEEQVIEVKGRLNAAGYQNVIAHGNSHKIMDSYNWSLMRLVEAHPEPMFDYVFLDGAHTWGIDALAFFLIDRLLNVGGYIDFHDYGWSLQGSPSMNPVVFPATNKMYTEEQIREQHVRLIVDLLVKRDQRYVEVVENRVFEKLR